MPHEQSAEVYVCIQSHRYKELLVRWGFEPCVVGCGVLFFFPDFWELRSFGFSFYGFLEL